MTKISGQRKNYFYIIYLIFVTILVGCVSNIQENYNYNGVTDTKSKIGLLLPVGSKNRDPPLPYLKNKSAVWVRSEGCPWSP